MSYSRNISALSDGLTTMQRLIVCIAEAYERTTFEEKTTNNSDAWIGNFWDCYHQYGNYSSYCMVTASVIVNSAAVLGKAFGNSTCSEVQIPNAPVAGSANREKTLYGNTYDTLNELLLSDKGRVDQTPQVGSVFMRPSDNNQTNHAGIVVSAPLRDDLYIETIEGNVSTTGFGGSKKGFQRVRYTKQAYNDFAGRAWIRSSRAAAYKNFGPKGWYYFHAWKNCDITAGIYSADLCLGVRVDCDFRTVQPPPPPPPSNCPPTPPANEEGYTPWQSVTKILALLRVDNPNIGTSIPVTDEYPLGREFTKDGCYVRWKSKDVPPPPPPPPPRKKCPDNLIMKGCCDGAATTLNFASKTEMLTVADLKNVGGRQSLLSTALDQKVFIERGFERRYQKAAEMFPQIRLSNGTAVTVLYKRSQIFDLADKYQLYGPAPAIIEVDRTAMHNIGNGAGWVERVANTFAPNSYTEVWPAKFLKRDDLNIVRGLFRNERFSFFDLIQTLDEKPDIFKGQQPVIIIGGDPTTGLDILESASGVIGAGLNIIAPGVGTLVVSAITLAANAYRTGALSFQDAFSFVGSLAAGLANAAMQNNDKKMFGVDAKVFADITKYSTTSYNIYGQLSGSGNPLEKARKIGAILERDVPEIRQYFDKNFANEQQWIRGAFAEINQQVNGALTTARASVQNVADSIATNTIGNLNILKSGTDALFSSLLTNDALGITKSAAKISTFQELLTSSPHPSILNTRAGAQDIFGRVLSLPSVFAADVTDGLVHNAIAGIVTGKRTADGALDQLTLDSLLYKAEDFARNKWKFDVPPTIPEDKRECFEREIAVCVGTECCAPKVMVEGVCMPPGTEPTTDCVREMNGQLMWCEPPSCGGASTAIEVSTVNLRTDSGVPYELTGQRRSGTRTWSGFTILVYEPVAGRNDYQRPTTQPRNAAESGINITSEDFENVRKDQDAPIRAAADQTEAQNARTQAQGGCVSVRPARKVDSGFQANIDGVWTDLVGCCPGKRPSGPPPSGGGECCDEIAVMGRKVDALATAIQNIGRTWTATQTNVATTQQRDTGVAPRTPCCDLTPVLELLRELPYTILSVNKIDAGRVSVDPTAVSRGDVSVRTPDDANNVAILQASLDRIERSIGGIKPGSPCDNTEVLSALVKLQTQLQRATIGYDDTVLQRKIDAIQKTLNERPTGTDDVALTRVLGELAQVRRDYAAVMNRLENFCAGEVKVCDTEMLRAELAKQTASIAELRKMLERGTTVDGASVERELLTQRDLLQAIVERLNSQSVTTSKGDVNNKDVVTTIVKCDDAELKAALSELKEMVRICPVMRKELQDFRTAVDRQYAQLRSELAVATAILRELQERDSSNGEVLREIRAQREEVLSLIESFSQVSRTCDAPEMKVLLQALQTTTNQNSDAIQQIITKLNQQGGGTTVCDTTIIQEAVRDVVDQRMDRIEATIAQLVRTIEDGGVRNVRVNVDQLDRPRQRDVRTSTESECTDCPAFVEEHRKVFYRYPQQQTTHQAQQAPPPVQVIPVEMPCDWC